MKKVRVFFTVLFLLDSLTIVLLIALFDNITFIRVANVIKHYIWPAGIAALVFVVLLFAGIFSNLANIERSLIRNGYFQFAILELFVFSAALGYYWHYSQQPGQIVVLLDSEANRDFINLGVKYQSSGSASIDTITAPSVLYKRPAGHYSFETLDEDIDHFHANVILEPAAIETLVIPIALNIKTLAVQTEPTGAQIWINGLETSQAPYTFKLLPGDTAILELKMPDYQTHVDTIILSENVDLGVIPLRKLYTLRVSCRYSDVKYKIYDIDDRVVFSASGSRKLQLAQGRYRISYEIGEGQYKTKSFSHNENSSVAIP